MDTPTAILPRVSFEVASEYRSSNIRHIDSYVSSHSGMNVVVHNEVGVLQTKNVSYSLSRQAI